MNRNKRLFQYTLLFAISTFSMKIINFLMVPFYTSIMQPKEYGYVDIIFSTSNLLLPVVALSIANGILRFLMDNDDEDYKKAVITNGLQITFGGSICAVLIGLISALVCENSQVVICIVFLLVTQSLFTTFGEIVRGLQEITVYAIANILLSVFTAIFGILLLKYGNQGSVGYVKSYVYAYSLVIVFLFFRSKIWKYVSFGQKDRKKIRWEMLKYSIFLIPNTIFWWITTASDKYMVLYFLGNAQNGLLGVANKIPIIITSVSQIFTQAWQLTAVADRKSEDRKSYFNNTFLNLAVFCILFSSIIILIIKPFMHIFADIRYFEAWKPAVILILSATFNILAAFVGSIYIVEKDNKANMISTLSGAVINIIFNLFMIPIWGLLGAAISTYLSYVVVFFYRIFDTRKYLSIDINKWGFFLPLILLFIQAFAAIFIENDVLNIIFSFMIIISSLKTIICWFQVIVSYIKNRLVRKHK